MPALLAARDAHLAAAAAAAARWAAAAAAVAAAEAEEQTAAAAAAAAEAEAEAEARAVAENEPLSPPDEFVCAISQQLMVDPVSADEGVTLPFSTAVDFMPSDSRYRGARFEPV